MTQQKTAVITAFLTLLLIGLGGIAVLKGALYIGKHEGDTLHLMQIVLRMADGQLPHLDFMTPIGALAFWPIALLVKAGMGMGMAIIWSQVIVAALFLPVLVWVARSRLTPWTGALFGGLVMVLLLALVHGEAERTVSISMHYNRLAWSAAFVAIVMAVLAPTHQRPVLDGAIIGAMACVMVMIKMTYFVSFAVPIVVGLILTGQARTLLMSVVSGAVIAVVITVFWGLEYWFAYEIGRASCRERVCMFV